MDCGFCVELLMENLVLVSGGIVVVSLCRRRRLPWSEILGLLDITSVVTCSWLTNVYANVRDVLATAAALTP